MDKIRESNFELLRVVSMFFIVLYHILFFVICKIDDSSLYKAMWLPLHVAVICFVLISGYFHIKPSVKGMAKLFFPLLVFYLPLTIFEMIQYGNGGIRNFFFFSKTPYWFVRTYFYLYLIAPVLNSYLSSNKRKVWLLFILGFMSVYMGWLMHDKSMVNGKNLVLFMFLYVLGDCLRAFKDKTDQISTRYFALLYFTLNFFLVLLFYVFSDSSLGHVIWNLSYPYCSPILIINAVLLFLIISRLHFKSRAINWLAGSVFAVYILHHQHYVLYYWIKPLVLLAYDKITSPVILIVSLGFISFILLFLFILIDKLFTPFQKRFLKAVSLCEDSLKKYFNNHVRISNQ